MAGRADRVLLGRLVRVGLLHHVTWSINSICHTIGERPFKSRDKSGNVWWLAMLSFGESWHNLHHADPTCARHGVLRGQIDTSARVIWISRSSAGRPTSAGRTSSERSPRRRGLTRHAGRDAPPATPHRAAPHAGPAAATGAFGMMGEVSNASTPGRASDRPHGRRARVPAPA